MKSVNPVAQWILDNPGLEFTSGTGQTFPALYDRLTSRQVVRDGCLEWSGYRLAKGYGVIQLGNQPFQVHRVVFYLAYGYWPHICRHSCDNPPCGEVEHLLDGTVADNARDSVVRGRHYLTKRIECPRGHPYDEANTYVKIGSRGDRHRVCRACKSAYQREHKSRDR